MNYKKEIKLSIIGTRGIPASYGGFETSVEETARRFASKGIKTDIYCRSNHYRKKINIYNGSNLIYVWSPRNKFFDTIVSTFLSIILLLKRKSNIVISYGVGNAMLIPFLSIFSVPVISVVDGADWRREKWGFFPKIYLKINSFFATKFSKTVVVDSVITREWYQKKYNYKCTYIPYGFTKKNKFDKNILKKYYLSDKKYIVFVGRFEKEKGVEFLIDNFNKLKTDYSLVVIGGNKLDEKYELKIKEMGNQNVIYLGFLYGKDYFNILKHAYFYVSTSYIEGTSPSLLNAMGINGFALVSNIEENIETLHGSCATFKVGDPEDFIDKVSYYLNNGEVIKREKNKTKKIVDKYYDWENITNKYISEIVKHLM